MFALPLDEDETNIQSSIAICVFVMCLALIAGIEFVVYGLKKRKFWAWVAGICIFAVYAPSLFFPLGALGLWACSIKAPAQSLAWGAVKSRLTATCRKQHSAGRRAGPKRLYAVSRCPDPKVMP